MEERWDQRGRSCSTSSGLHRARTTVAVESARLCAAGSPADTWYVADNHIWIGSVLEPAGTDHRLVESR
jgi:hypothetical protein